MKSKLLLTSIFFILAAQITRAQSINFPNPYNEEYGDTFGTGNLTYSGGTPASVVFQSLTPNILQVSLDGSQLLAIGVGKGIAVATWYDAMGNFIVQGSGDINVLPAPLTITGVAVVGGVQVASIVWAPVLPTVTFEPIYSGFVNGDGPGSLPAADIPPSYLYNGYDIYPDFPGNWTQVPCNYNIGYPNGALTITPLYNYPTATTTPPTNLTGTGATINGTVNDNGAPTTVTLEYTGIYEDGPKDFVSVPLTTGPNPLPAGSGLTSYSAVLTGLSPTQTYYYRIIASNPEFTAPEYNDVLTFTPASSSDASLSQLQIIGQTISPTFTAANTSYIANVVNTVSSITVKAVTSNAAATLSINGTPVPAGGPWPALSLAVGLNPINVVVTAPDGTTVPYTINVTRALSSNAFLSSLGLPTPFETLTTVPGPDYRDYTASVPYGTISIEALPVTADPTATITVNGAAVTSGTNSNPLPLAVGPNPITIVVTAQDGVTTETYVITVTRAPSSNAFLSSLSLANPFVTLTTVPGPDYRDYTASVPYGTTTIEALPVTADPLATITVNGTGVATGTNSSPLPLAAGPNPITIVVTAQDHVTTKTYVITVTRAPSSNAFLSSLSLGNPFEALTTVAGPDYRDYTASVPYGTTTIEALPVTADPLATITVNGTAVTSGTNSSPLPLVAGPNPITVAVTAQDGITTETYVITVTPASPNNAYLSSLGLRTPFETLTTVPGPDYRDYIASVPYGTTSIEALPVTADPAATITVNGTAVASGTNSNPLPLVVGPNPITIVVTAEDHVTTKTYVITVTRAPASNAFLSSLSLANPFEALVTVAGPDYRDYTASVSTGTSSIEALPVSADPTATITVNGTAVTSGANSSPLPLAVGPNPITIVVTAGDGVTTETYVITVTRAPSTNAFLSSLSLTKPFEALTTVPGPDYRDYTASVPYGTNSIEALPVTSNAGATITVDGSAVTSGTNSSPLPLAVGPNPITIVVTAQDGITTETYVITVTQAPPPGAFRPENFTGLTDSTSMANDHILVHQGVSPNGDGINDFLVIEGITNYPDNHLMIINRNGALIYQAKGYDNSKGVFDGHSNINGRMQAPGTYFYTLDYSVNGVLKHRTGYIVLKY